MKHNDNFYYHYQFIYEPNSVILSFYLPSSILSDEGGYKIFLIDSTVFSVDILFLAFCANQVHASCISLTNDVNPFSIA